MITLYQLSPIRNRWIILKKNYKTQQWSLLAIITLIKRLVRTNARPIDFTEPFNRCAGTRKRGPALINPQIMIAVRLRPWDLRLATGPITYPPPYRRICVAGQANLLTDNVYRGGHRVWVERIHGFMKQKGKQKGSMTPFEFFYPLDGSRIHANRRRKDFDKKLIREIIVSYNLWKMKFKVRKVWNTRNWFIRFIEK